VHPTPYDASIKGNRSILEGRVDVAAGGPGDAPATSGAGARTRLDIGLFVVALVLACACVFGGVLVLQQHRDDQRAQEEQERYGEVLAAARDVVEAFVNIDYRDAQESIDAVAAGATGDLAEQYDSSAEGVVQQLERERSVIDGEVLWAGVSDLDADSATVLVATAGTVQNRSTGGEPVDRTFRLELDLQRVGDAWLASNLEFVR
jgi:Mce-associated membrane protein